MLPKVAPPSHPLATIPLLSFLSLLKSGRPCHFSFLITCGSDDSLVILPLPSYRSFFHSKGAGVVIITKSRSILSVLCLDCFLPQLLYHQLLGNPSLFFLIDLLLNRPGPCHQVVHIRVEEIHTNSHLMFQVASFVAEVCPGVKMRNRRGRQPTRG